MARHLASPESPRLGEGKERRGGRRPAEPSRGEARVVLLFESLQRDDGGKKSIVWAFLFLEGGRDRSDSIIRRG